uniref:hypothetical protein n=1 Tax=Acinetobacter baumannii TaxID=470 RepID=UPI0007443601
SSFENYIAEKAFTDRFVQQSRFELMSMLISVHLLLKKDNTTLSFAYKTNELMRASFNTMIFPTSLHDVPR